MKRLLIQLLGLLLFAALPAAAQEVTLERDSPLYAEARLESAQVAQLKQGSGGEVVGKQGAWLNVKTPAGTGWLLSFNVRFQKAEGAGGSAAGPMVGPRRNVTVTAAIGVRGLDEQDLRQASFNADQMKSFDDYVATKQAAEDAARATGLAPAQVEYLGAKK